MEQSRQVHSPQDSCYEHTRRIVARHLQTPYLKPIASYSRECFEKLLPLLNSHSGALILDSGCGVGESTLRLAHENSEALVIGIDKSALRTTRHASYKNSFKKEVGRAPENALIIRAEATDLWRLFAEHSITMKKHYLLYPNPWPKPKHFQRRWHGHPAFAALLQISDSIELRSNWHTYVEEFALAVRVGGKHQGRMHIFECGKPITPFERKYVRSGHKLYSFACSIPPANENA